MLIFLFPAAGEEADRSDVDIDIDIVIDIDIDIISDVDIVISSCWRRCR